MKVKLTKIFRPETNDGSGPRTDVIVGETNVLPVIGERFRMTAPPLVSGDIRIVSTSNVMSIEKMVEGIEKHIDAYKIVTESGSVYAIVYPEGTEGSEVVDSERDTEINPLPQIIIDMP